MEVFFSLVIPFVSLIFLVGLCESVVKFLLEEIIHLSDRTEQVIGYVLTAIFAFFIAMFGDYRFLNYLDVYFVTDWMDWGMSALIIAAGSGFLEKKFDFMNLIPGIIGGVQSTSVGLKNKIRKDPKYKDGEINNINYGHVEEDQNNNFPTI